MISYGKQTIDQQDIDSVVEALKSDWLTQGPLVKSFEQKLCDYFRANHCSIVSNGTAALHLTGLVLGWQSGDYVMTTPITFLASANCILYSGATPVFVDIDEKAYTIDVNLVEKTIKEFQLKGKKIKAVIAVDYAGYPCDWKHLRKLADEYNLQLVNDNCHAIGTKYNNDIGYGVKYADVVIQSYHPIKHITTGEGGSILTNDANIDKKIKNLRSHGMTKDPSLLIGYDGPWYYEMHELGFNYRITDIQCALGISQLSKLESFVLKRRIIAANYNDAFSDINGITVPRVSENNYYSYHLYPLLIDFRQFNVDKLAFFAAMKDRGILLQVHYIPVHLQPYYKKNFGFKYGDYPIAEDFYTREISIPIYPDLTESDQEKVIDSIKSILGLL